MWTKYKMNDRIAAQILSCLVENAIDFLHDEVNSPILSVVKLLPTSSRKQTWFLLC